MKTCLMWPRGFLSRLLLRATAGATDGQACARIHALLVKSGHASDTRLATALADAYAKSGLVAPARMVFDETPRRDLVLWSVMISCYSSHGMLQHSWALFAAMRRSAGLSGDGFTFSALLSGRALSSSCSHHHPGILAHGLVLRLGLHLDLVVATALLDMYAKCGRVAEARRVFDAMLLRNSVSWNAMIVCYGQHGGGKEALQLFVSMLRNDDGCCCRADELTLASLLSSCANMAAAYEATQLHAYALKRGLQGYLQVANALIMAYGAWSELAKVRSHMRNMCGSKVPGCSWIEVGGKVQTFVSNDISLQQSTEMLHMMDIIVTFVKKEFNEDTISKESDLVSEWC
nr:pentatricopeptide repeat-containing protein At2g46050, mitochondrial-like [Lolium perenne]